MKRSQAVLLGVFKVGDCERSAAGVFHYELESVSDFDSLTDRLVIDWGQGAVSWVQWYDRNDKAVVQILPDG